MPLIAMQYVKRRLTTKDFALVLLVQNLGRSGYHYNSHMQWSLEKMRATVGVPKPFVCLYPGVNQKATRLDDVFDIVVPYDVISVCLLQPKRLVSISISFDSVSVVSGLESHKTWPAFLIKLFLNQDNCSVWFQRLWVAQLRKWAINVSNEPTPS